MRLSTRHCLVAESMKIAFGKCKLFLFCSPTFCQLQCKIDRKTFVMQKVFLKFQQKLLTIKSAMLIL